MNTSEHTVNATANMFSLSRSTNMLRTTADNAYDREPRPRESPKFSPLPNLMQSMESWAKSGTVPTSAAYTNRYTVPINMGVAGRNEMERYATVATKSNLFINRGMVKPLTRSSSLANNGESAIEHMLAPPVTRPIIVLLMPLAPKNIAANAQHALLSAHQET